MREDNKALLSYFRPRRRGLKSESASDPARCARRIADQGASPSQPVRAQGALPV